MTDGLAPCGHLFDPDATYVVELPIADGYGACIVCGEFMAIRSGGMHAIEKGELETIPPRALDALLSARHKLSKDIWPLAQLLQRNNFLHRMKNDQGSTEK